MRVIVCISVLFFPFHYHISSFVLADTLSLSRSSDRYTQIYLITSITPSFTDKQQAIYVDYNRMVSDKLVLGIHLH